MSGELFRLPWSHIQNGLEKLAGSLPEDDTVGLWQRLRLDDDFRARVVKHLLEEDKRPVEAFFELEVDYSMPRSAMYKQIYEARMDVLQPGLIEALGAHSVMYVGQKIHATEASEEGNKKKIKLYIVPLLRDLDAHEARIELKRRGFKPAQTEEALTFYLHTRGDFRGMEGVFALDATVIWENVPHCLKFSHAFAGNLLMDIFPLEKKTCGSFGHLATRIRPD